MPLKGLKEKLNYITCSILLIQPSQRILQIWWKYSQLSNFVRCCNRQIFNVINTAKSILYLHYHLGQFGASYFQMPIHFFLAFLFICSVTSNLIFEFSSILSIATVISLLLLWFKYLLLSLFLGILFMYLFTCLLTFLHIFYPKQSSLPYIF